MPYLLKKSHFQMYTYSVLPLDVTNLDLHVEDQSSYELQTLKLNAKTGQQHNSFEVIGKGGFGSIYKGTVRRHRKHIDMTASVNKSKEANHSDATEFKGVNPGDAIEFIGVKRLGKFHGFLLEKAADSSLPHLHDCVDLEGECMVAVKQIALSYNEANRLDLDREARTMRVFWGCRNFASVYGLTYCKELENVCIVMELISGCNLNEFLRTRGTVLFNDQDEKLADIINLWSSNEMFWWIQKLSLFREIVLALMLCHGKKVCHGDLKGPNILVDKRLIPKLIDFGLSFQARDIKYLKEMHGSPFWVAPEICGEDGVDDEVKSDPFPSDVYSLGMLLFEILLDGKIPDSYTDTAYLVLDKWNGVYPVSLDDVQSNDLFLSNNVVKPLKDLVDKCCEVNRKKRISLQNCLSVVEKVHSGLISRYHCADHCARYEMNKVVIEGYEEMLHTFSQRFPDVHDYLVLSPSRNMVISEDGTLLVHSFCTLDFVEGVRYIVEQSTWDFQPERDIPLMSLLCVENESLNTLKYIAASWRDVLVRQLLLIHKACSSSNLSMFKLLLEVGIDFDTWIAEEPFMKPIHQLAAKGKTEFLRCLLDHPGVDANYINTASNRYGRCYDGNNTEKIISFSRYVDANYVNTASHRYRKRVDGINTDEITSFSGDVNDLKRQQEAMLLPKEFQDVPKLVPLYYAVVEDRVDTVKFILERGGLYVGKEIQEVPRLSNKPYWFCSLMQLALQSFSIGVLLELRYTPEECASPPLDILRQHVADASVSNSNRKPIHLACQRGKEKVLKATFDLVSNAILDDTIGSIADHVIGALMFYVARGGSNRMVDYILRISGHAVHHFNSQAFSMVDVACLLLAEVTTTKLFDDTKSSVSLEDVARASGNEEVFKYLAKLHPTSSDSEDHEDVGADTSEDLDVHRGDLELSSRLEAEVISMHLSLEKPFNLALDCCRKGQVGVLKFYEECCGLNLNAIRENENQKSILHFAIDSAHLDMVKHLLERGFSVSSTDWWMGETPLQHACSRRLDVSRSERRRKKDIAIFLLEKGADPNYVSQGGYTAMDQPLDFHDKEIVQLLIDNGFDLGKKDRYGEDYMTRVANI